MEINILAFGQIEEIIGSNHITLSEVSDTEALKIKLSKDFPEINTIPYSISVNKNIINGYHKLEDGDEVALLPPFSGG
jgi:sulfur-carrier protein